MIFYGDCGVMGEDLRAAITVDIERWLAHDVNRVVWWNIGRPVYDADRTDAVLTEFLIEVGGNQYEEA